MNYGNMFNWLAKHGVPTHALRLQLLEDVALGMNHLHSHSPPIVHRDLKSPNVLVCCVCCYLCGASVCARSCHLSVRVCVRAFVLSASS